MLSIKAVDNYPFISLIIIIIIIDCSIFHCPVFNRIHKLSVLFSSWQNMTQVSSETLMFIKWKIEIRIFSLSTNTLWHTKCVQNGLWGRVLHTIYITMYTMKVWKMKDEYWSFQINIYIFVKWEFFLHFIVIVMRAAIRMSAIIFPQTVDICCGLRYNDKWDPNTYRNPTKNN